MGVCDLVNSAVQLLNQQCTGSTSLGESCTDVIQKLKDYESESCNFLSPLEGGAIGLAVVAGVALVGAGLLGWCLLKKIRANDERRDEEIGNGGQQNPAFDENEDSGDPVNDNARNRDGDRGRRDVVRDINFD